LEDSYWERNELEKKNMRRREKKMKKIFKIFLWGIGSFIGLMLLGFIASVIFAPKTTPVPSKVEVSLKSIVGNWYIVCSSPKYRNKIAIDYIIFAFREDGTVVKTTNSKMEKGGIEI